MLGLILARLGHARRLERIVVATSDRPDDDRIAAEAARAGVDARRGPLDDVLGRFVLAAEDAEGPIVRITGDCPLADPAIVDEAVALFEADPDCRYASNVEPRTYPDGLDVEVVDARTLRELDAELTDPQLREHVTLAIRLEPERYAVRALVHEPSLGDLRWTVDTSEDLQFVREVLDRLGERRHEAAMDEILAAIRADPPLTEGGRRG
jgi:spore coat polysaccharide biosynthesis protein SpsF (cytidylyltransferase family)